MSDIASRRLYCQRCALPARTCVCALVTPAHNDVDVLVLQHPDEAREAKNSARLLRLSLARCRVVVGDVFEPQTLLALLDGDVSGNALLYPPDTKIDFVGMRACPLEHLEFALWMLREQRLIYRSDSNHFEITVQGVEAFEADQKDYGKKALIALPAPAQSA